MNLGVIGGGTLGLTLAYRLGNLGHHVTVLEAAPQVGGLATWYDYGPFVWDKYYHVILKQDACLLSLIDDLGLSGSMNWNQTRTGFLWNGRHLSMSSTKEFVTFPALSLLQKLRLGLGILRIQRIHDAAPLERISARDWMTRIFGRSVYEAIWAPLLASKFGVLQDKVPATIMWATIRRYYETRSENGKEYMGFLSGGLRTMYESLCAEITTAGGTVRNGAAVVGLAQEGSGVRVTLRDGSTMRFDHAFSTVPTNLLQSWLPSGVEAASDVTAARPQSLGIICCALVLNRPLSPYYVTNLIQAGFTFTGIIELTALTGSEAMNGHHLVMLPRYDVPDSAWFNRSDADISETFLSAMRPIWPDLDASIVSCHVNRERHVQALWIEAPPANTEPRKYFSGRLWSINAELAGRDTLNNNAIVRVADEAAAAWAKSHALDNIVPLRGTKRANA